MTFLASPENKYSPFNYPFLPIFLTPFLSCQLQRDSETPPPAPVSESKEKHDCCKDNDCPSTESGASPSVPSKNATTAKELRDLMYRHYCVGKGKLKKPSANAIKKGKVPPPTCSTLNQNQNKPHQHCTKGAHTDSDTEELSEEDDDGSDDTSSETSKVNFRVKLGT